MAGWFAPTGGGTRFRIFPQAPFGLTPTQPIEVELSPPLGSVGIGPHDERMCVIRPTGKDWSYGERILREASRRVPLPPWRGPVAPPARPGSDGGFAHLDPADPTFDQAHAYACVRLALDVWEGYLGRTIPWHFGRRWLEIGLLEQAYDNGEVGWGWLELGWDLNPDRAPHAFARNLDVIAHEVGHLIIYGIVGEPTPDRMNAEYAGFHEAFADLASLLVVAHLDPVVDQVLQRARGNLYGVNELNRLGELSSTTQIRIASNGTKMSEFALGWSDEHDLSEPLTGALFDLLLDIYQSNLVARGLVPPSLVDFADERAHLRAFAATIQGEYDRWYPRAPSEFRRAFDDARDYLGGWLSHILLRLQPNSVTFAAVRDALLEADHLQRAGHGRHILENFAWRQIGEFPPGPFLGSRAVARLHCAAGLHRCANRGIDTGRHLIRRSA